MRKLELVYKYNRPYGIRSEDGYLIFFYKITKFQGQEERYQEEVKKQFVFADKLLELLKKEFEVNDGTKQM